MNPLAIPRRLSDPAYQDAYAPPVLQALAHLTGLPVGVWRWWRQFTGADAAGARWRVWPGVPQVGPVKGVAPWVHGGVEEAFEALQTVGILPPDSLERFFACGACASSAGADVCHCCKKPRMLERVGGARPADYGDLLGYAGHGSAGILRAHELIAEAARLHGIEIERTVWVGGGLSSSALHRELNDSRGHRWFNRDAAVATLRSSGVGGFEEWNTVGMGPFRELAEVGLTVLVPYGHQEFRVHYTNLTRISLPD